MKILRSILILIIIFAFVAGYYVYDIALKPNAESDGLTTVLIPSESDFEELTQILSAENLITRRKFRTCAKWMDFSTVKSGRYSLNMAWSNRQLINHLRQGLQEPIDVIIRPTRFATDIARQVSEVLETDSSAIAKRLFSVEFLSTSGYDSANVSSLFIPNTYELYWNTDAEQFLERMLNENDRFWKQDNRIEKARILEMSKHEVATLASIVERESQYNPERPRIAGLYLNRLRDGIPLQADPTVVHATGEFGLRRVLNKHLRFESPYNTYLNQGLPPGPIYIPSIQSIDAVLNAEDHDLYYMCAKPDAPGQHAFASTLREHNRNARVYRNWLNARGIR